MRTWYRVIKDYNRRGLTFGTDKLPALEGPARYESALTLDMYHFDCKAQHST